MPVSDDIRKEKEKTKNMSFKGKLSYFWDYYKIHTIVAIVAAIILVTVIRDIRANKDYAFYGTYFNASPTFSAEEQMDAFAVYAGIDTEKYRALLDTTMYLSLTDMSGTTIATSQKFAAMTYSSEVDMVVADEDIFANYAVNEMFYDLREVLPEDLLEQYKDAIFYIDRAEIKAANNEEVYLDNEDDSQDHQDLAETFQDHHNPSVMEDPVPVGIYVGDTPVITEAGCYKETVPVYGIVANTKRLDMAIAYLRFLGEEPAAE